LEKNILGREGLFALSVGPRPHKGVGGPGAKFWPAGKIPPVHARQQNSGGEIFNIDGNTASVLFDPRPNKQIDNYAIKAHN
jgi:hypothetical protein